jgi:hypothetical protein
MARCAKANPEHHANRMQEVPSEVTSQRRRLLALWQESLGQVAERLKGDIITEALIVSSSRVLLLTDKHVALCKSKHLANGGVNYRVKWLVRLVDVTNVLCACLRAPSDRSSCLPPGACWPHSCGPQE